MAGAKCRNCDGLDWVTEGTPDEVGRCRVCREFPTLGYDCADLIQDVCVIPDGDHQGEPLILTDEMVRFLLHLYRIDPTTGRFTYFRGGQLVRPQKWGKGPFASAWIIGEAHPEGVSRFDGWNADGQPVGKPWPTPWIQVAAVSEDQTDNVWSSLQPMIELGDVHADIPDTGLTRILLPNGGKIEPVTSSGSSRLGQKITGAVQDEAHSWLKSNGGHKVGDTQRRNLAGMKGRFLETGNAWDPREDSVAQRTSEGTAPGVYKDDVDPGPGSVRNKQDRRRMLKRVYGDSMTKPRADAPWEPWIDQVRIDGEIEALLEHDPSQAERFFLNRKQAGEDVAFDLEAFAKNYKSFEPPAGDVVVVGVDGARFDDALALVGTHVKSGHQWPIAIIERPENAPLDYEHDFEAADGAMVEAFDTWHIWRVYVDPQKIENLVERWQGRWGEKRVIPWYMNRPRQAAWAVRKYQTAISTGDATHNGDATFAQHVKNARKEKVNVLDDKKRQMHVLAKDGQNSPRKIDGAAAGTLSWEARGDCIAAGEDEHIGEPMAAWI